MVTISNTTNMVVDITVDDRNIAFVQPGLTVELSDWNGSTFAGTVTAINMGAAESQNGMTNYPVTLTVDNQDGSLLAGMYLDYSFVASQSDDCMMVPMQSVKNIPSEDGTSTDYVVFIRADERPENAVDLGGGMRNEDFTLNYRGTGTASSEVAGMAEEDTEATMDGEMHLLRIPRGGEYTLVLADGTVVFLNAETELRYPARFSGESRTVYLHGEAYFSVTKDSARAFIVQVGGVDVKVYGTEFCVNTHGEGQVETVLVNGSVGMKTAGEEIVLRPGEKGTFLGEGKRIQVEAVDVLPYVSWRTGDFIFRDESLETIMDKLARWYNLEVFFRNDAAREVRLSGNLKRDKDVRELFHSFERISDVRFSVNGNTVVVSV